MNTYNFLLVTASLCLVFKLSIIKSDRNTEQRISSLETCWRKGLPELKQSPKYAAVSSNGVVTGVNGKHISLSCPEH